MRLVSQILLFLGGVERKMLWQIVLERKWTRNTHAKHFPAEAWRTRFGEVIGASHSHSYRYWAYGGRASQGMQEMAEHGSTRTLENEIRENTQVGFQKSLNLKPSYPNPCCSTRMAMCGL